MSLNIIGLTSLIVILASAGCSRGPQYTQDFSVYPVSGVVEVDGVPAEMVWIKVIPVEGTSELKAPLTTLTDGDGHFTFTTYKAHDGLPKGEYVMTFKWEGFGLGHSGDKLNGKYADAAKSDCKFKIEELDENDLGTFSLSSK